jgi:hypothetical protein
VLDLGEQADLDRSFETLRASFVEDGGEQTGPIGRFHHAERCHHGMLEISGFVRFREQPIRCRSIRNYQLSRCRRRRISSTWYPGEELRINARSSIRAGGNAVRGVDLRMLDCMGSVVKVDPLR